MSVCVSHNFTIFIFSVHPHMNKTIPGRSQGRTDPHLRHARFRARSLSLSHDCLISMCVTWFFNFCRCHMALQFLCVTWRFNFHLQCTPTHEWDHPRRKLRACYPMLEPLLAPPPHQSRAGNSGHPRTRTILIPIVDECRKKKIRHVEKNHNKRNQRLLTKISLTSKCTHTQ